MEADSSGSYLLILKTCLENSLVENRSDMSGVQTKKRKTELLFNEMTIKVKVRLI